MGRYNAQPGTHGTVTLPALGRLTNAAPITLQDGVAGTLAVQGPGAVTIGRNAPAVDTLQLEHGATVCLGGESVRVGRLVLASGATLSATSEGAAGVKTVVLDGDEPSFLFGSLKAGPRDALAVRKTGDGVLYVSGRQPFAGALTIDDGVVRVQDEAAPFLSGIAFHLDAAEKACLKIGADGTVTEWKEQLTGAVLHQTAPGCPCPAYQAQGINGLPAVYFAGLTNRLATSHTFTQQTVFIVNQPEGSPQYGGIWGAEHAGHGTDYGIRCVCGNVWAGGTNLPYNYFNSFSRFRIDGTEGVGFTPGQPHILCAQRDRADLLTMPVALGSYFWPMGRSYKGKIGEVLAYSRLLTEAERRAVENYLSKKWLGKALHAQGEEGAKEERRPPALAGVCVGKQGTLDLNGMNLRVTALSGSGRIINSRAAPVALTVEGQSAFVGEMAQNVRLVTVAGRSAAAADLP